MRSKVTDLGHRKHKILQESAEFAPSVGKVGNRFVEGRFGKLRPTFVGDPNFGVANLPQQKITDPHFARRADQKIGIVAPRCVEMCRNQTLINLLGGNFTGGDFFTNRLHSVNNLRAAAVVDREIQPHAIVLATHFDRVVEFSKDMLGNIRPSTHHTNPQIVLHDRRPLGNHVLLEQVHQEVDLLLRALPVLA